MTTLLWRKPFHTHISLPLHLKALGSTISMRKRQYAYQAYSALTNEHQYQQAQLPLMRIKYHHPE